MSHWTDRKSNNGYGYGQYTALDVLQAKKSCEKDEQRKLAKPCLGVLEYMPHFDDREKLLDFCHGAVPTSQDALAAIFGPLMC